MRRQELRLRHKAFAPCRCHCFARLRATRAPLYAPCHKSAAAASYAGAIAAVTLCFAAAAAIERAIQRYVAATLFTRA